MNDDDGGELFELVEMGGRLYPQRVLFAPAFKSDPTPGAALERESGPTPDLVVVPTPGRESSATSRRWWTCTRAPGPSPCATPSSRAPRLERR